MLFRTRVVSHKPTISELFLARLYLPAIFLLSIYLSISSSLSPLWLSKLLLGLPISFHVADSSMDALRSGNFGVVKLGLHRATGQRYAIKIIEKKKFWMQSGDRKDALMDEVKILKHVCCAKGLWSTRSPHVSLLMQVNHPNIINIKEIFDSPTHLYLVLELSAVGGSCGMRDTAFLAGAV